ncbi:putative sulfate exporter family transporter [Nocardia terrae]|uniref:putative sulfate exporter family transporter n=1 Tax=Nocardia terrae TaxID=2675851 RepID=UPI0038B3DE74
MSDIAATPELTQTAAETDSDGAAFDEPSGPLTLARLLSYVPGIALLIAVGVLGKYAEIWWLKLAKHEHWTVPDIEYVLWAILIGLLITNIVGLHPIFKPGIGT